jgi:hypothetical protein
MKKLLLFLRFSIILLFFFIISCISPYINEGNIPVYVVCDYLHCGIVTYEDISSTKNRYIHYTFVDYDWYVGGNTGFTEFFRAIFLESKSAVEEGIYEGEKQLSDIASHLFYAETPDAWLFYVSEENYQKGLDYIDTHILGDKGKLLGNLSSALINFSYYETDKNYYIFFNCNHFVAYTLQVMGIDIKASWYNYSMDIMRSKLNSLTDMIEF